MGFYEEISEYYNYIFPVGQEQLKFIMENAGKPPKKLLDIACGTGSYSVELAEKGYGVTAVDIDDAMLNKLRVKVRKGLDLDIIKADMLSLSEHINGSFDMIFCIGNSIVHLEDTHQIDSFMKQGRGLLNENGKALFQIINYDRILEKGVDSLPTIKNHDIGLVFERKYFFEKASGKILFKTTLSVGDKKMDNTIELYPLKSDELKDILLNAEFSGIKFYGDFKGSEYDKSASYMLVAVAE